MQKFETGAVRSNDRVPRYGLIPEVGLRRLAETCTEGADKYGVDNWRKGIPASNLLDHALNHLERWRDGDTSEDHLGHALWNIAVIAHLEERMPEMVDIAARKKVDNA